MTIQNLKSSLANLTGLNRNYCRLNYTFLIHYKNQVLFTFIRFIYFISLYEKFNKYLFILVYIIYMIHL